MAGKNGGTVDYFKAYVRTRLDRWGDEFALHRDCEYLGHASKNPLQVLIEHKGEMPSRSVGFKPLEVDREAHEIELMVTEVGRENAAAACVLRAMYCGRGRRNVERWEQANRLLAKAELREVNQRAYYELHKIGFDWVRSALFNNRASA